MSINRVILLGYVGQDPVYKEFQNGRCVAQFSLATTKKGYTAKDGTKMSERTEWHNIILQNGLAKVANQYIKKGNKLYLEGELRTRSYEDKSGVIRSVTEIYCNFMEKLTQKESVNNTEQQDYSQSDESNDLYLN